MNERQEKLFINIVKEHIKSGSPVGSKFLTEKFHLDVSPATVRNDMAELEQEGLICQPYTSAGRVPTEEGYRYYLKNYLSQAIVAGKKEKTSLDMVVSGNEKENIADRDFIKKQLAKKVAELSHGAVIMAFSRSDIYYTGISNLFSQPEFADMNIIYSISEVVDSLDDVISKVFSEIEDVDIKIGRDNYFSDKCASVFRRKGDKVVGILGPVRMDYESNLGLLDYMIKWL